MYEIYRLSTMNEGNGMDKEAAIKRMIGAAVFLSLVACSGEENSDASDPSGVIPRHQLDALDRAKNTEALIMDADKRRQEQLAE